MDRAIAAALMGDLAGVGEAQAPVEDRPVALADLRFGADLTLFGPGLDGVPVTRSFLSELNRGWLGLPVLPRQQAWTSAWRRLYADALNMELPRAPGHITVRLKGGIAAAPLSGAYASLTNAEAVVALRRRGRFGLVWANTTMHTFDLALRWEDGVLNLGPDDRFFGGVHIFNSETGHGRLRVGAYLYREACANGTIVGKAGQRTFLDEVHRGGGLDRHFGEAVDRALSYLPRLMRPLRRLQEQRVSARRLSHAMSRISRAVGEPGAARFRSYYRLEPGASAYALYNAVTHWAQRYQGARRRALEELGGNLLAQ